MCIRDRVKITQASRDGGVDAIAFDPDPIRGGKIVIQAKRYTNVVSVSAVRDLYGTVVNEGATKGILVTTSGYGHDAYDFAKGKTAYVFKTMVDPFIGKYSFVKVCSGVLKGEDILFDTENRCV